MKVKKMTTASLLIAVGVVSAHLIYIPVGVSKVFPVQHAINLLAAIMFGPAYSVAIAFLISLIRNLLGTGSLLAFPGSMIGAFLASLLYKKMQKPIYAMFGEVFGTGIIGAIICYPVAKYFMGKEAAVFFYISPFVASSCAGVVIGYVIFRIILRTGVLKLYESQGSDIE